MSDFLELWKGLNGRVGKAVQLVVDYESKENGRNVRVFESEREYNEWCLEMGENIKVISVRKSGKPMELTKSYVVRVNGQDHMCTDDEKEARAYLQMLREGGTFGVIVEQTVLGTAKNRVTKPNGTHTAKWDRCVEHVRSNNPGADPYAVCTAMLGDESFKSMDEEAMNAVIDKALEEIGKDMFGVGSFGIAGAGPIPTSLLARQDLEGSSSQKSFTSVGALTERIKANQKQPVAKGSAFKDLWAKVKAR